MTGFNLRISCVGSDCSTNCATVLHHDNCYFQALSFFPSFHLFALFNPFFAFSSNKTFSDLGSKKGGSYGQWLWLSWQSGRFQYQRSAIRIQSLAKFIEHLFAVNCIEKTKIKKKEAENGPFLKKIWIRNSRRKKFYGTSHKPYNAILIPFNVSI